MQSSEKQIEHAIKAKPTGTLVFPEDFAAYGSSKAIQKALDRLENKNLLARVAHGIYVRPKQSDLIGSVLPSGEEVAEGIT